MDISFRVKIFKSLFQGREDVFAIRWEKGSKSGYMPAYQYDPYAYPLHKMKGEAFKDFRNSGRQVFLEYPPKNFFRIHHDYSDDKKGFIIWKDMLEERLL